MLYQIEASCQAIKDKLDGALGDKIAEINAADEQGVQIEPPTAISIGPRYEMFYPHVAIVPSDTENLVDSGGRIHYLHRIRLISWLAHPDEEVLIRQLMRYARAVRETALRRRRPAEDLGDPGGYSLTFEADDYGPVMGEEPGAAFVAWVGTTVAVRQQQDIG